MNDDLAVGNYYTIGHVVLITGLTDRTIRNYISLGLLEGEKINGLWHFTPEQVQAFVAHPSVRPSIQAKKNSIVHDFMLMPNRQTHRSCLMLDIPERDPKEVAEFFCYAINTGGYEDIRFSFDSLEGTNRVILCGNTETVLELATRFYI